MTWHNQVMHSQDNTSHARSKRPLFMINAHNSVDFRISKQKGSSILRESFN